MTTLPNLLCGLTVALLATLNQTLAAQTATEQTQSESAASERATPTSSDAGMYLRSLTVTPLSRVTPGGVLSVRCVVVNSGNAPASGYLVGRIDGQVGEEDRRRVELGAGEQRSVDVQLRLSNTLPPTAVDITMTLNVMQGDREVLAHLDNETVSRKLHLPIGEEKNVTAISLDREPSAELFWRWPPMENYHTYELVMATRIDARLSRQCAVLDGEPLSLNRVDWKNVNTLVVSHPEVFNDIAGIAMMQQFLQNGGRIWIMLDHIDTSLVQDLLDEDQQIETVDTVALHRFEIAVADQSYAVEDRTVDSVTPILMKRVAQQGGQVFQSVDGWPAAVWMQVGRGELAFTCLGSAAWVEPRKSQFTGDPRFQTPFTLPIWANSLAQRIHNNKQQPPLALAKAAYPVDRIGNPVVARSFVAIVLSTFCMSLIALAVWRSMGKQIRWMGAVVPALATAGSLPLLISSTMQRRDIPKMQSALQFVQVEPRAGTFMRESVAMYSDASEAMDLIADHDGLAVPAESIESGIRTLVADGFQSWRLSNSAWPTGTWRYSTEYSLPELVAEANARITQTGLEIDLPAAIPSPVQDVVLTLVPGAPVIGKVVDGTNRILVTGDLPAEGERWTADVIVNDEQRRRAAIYRELFEDPKSTALPMRTLCGWTELWPQAPKWNAEFERRGTALVTLPIRVATPAVGSAVRIPYSMIEIQHASMQGGSSIFNQAKGRFSSESTLEVKSDLAFLLPREVTPIDLTALAIDWDIKAPKRNAKLSCIVDGEAIELANLNEPSIPFKSSVRDAHVLQSMRDGRLELRIEIQSNEARSSEQSNFVSWQIKHLRLTVEGNTLPRNQLVKSKP